MTVIPFPTSGLSRRDLETIDAFCADRRDRGVGAYLSVRRLDEAEPERPNEIYAAITDRPKGRTTFIIDRADSTYRARYFDSSKRRTLVIAEGRSLDGVLKAIPEWPAPPLRRVNRRSPS